MYRLKRLEIWLVITVIILFATGISTAAPTTGKKFNAVSNSLLTHIKKDTAEKIVKVEITHLAEIEMSKTKQTIFGEAYLISKEAKFKTPIYFEATFNSFNSKVSVVDYTFVENGSQRSTEFLTKLLIKQVGIDYKTKEVAVAFDRVELIKKAGYKEIFRGYGEVRIGSLMWKKVKFEIRLDASSERVLYQLYKM